MPCLIRGIVRRTAGQYETPFTITAIDEASFVDLKPDTRMSERRPTRYFARAIATDAAIDNGDCFGSVAHAAPLATGLAARNGSEISDSKVEATGVVARSLACAHGKNAANADRLNARPWKQPSAGAVEQ